MLSLGHASTTFRLASRCTLGSNSVKNNVNNRSHPYQSASASVAPSNTTRHRQQSQHQVQIPPGLTFTPRKRQIGTPRSSLPAESKVRQTQCSNNGQYFRLTQFGPQQQNENPGVVIRSPATSTLTSNLTSSSINLKPLNSLLDLTLTNPAPTDGLKPTGVPAYEKPMTALISVDSSQTNESATRRTRQVGSILIIPAYRLPKPSTPPNVPAMYPTSTERSVPPTESADKIEEPNTVITPPSIHYFSVDDSEISDELKRFIEDNLEEVPFEEVSEAEPKKMTTEPETEAGEAPDCEMTDEEMNKICEFSVEPKLEELTNDSCNLDDCERNPIEEISEGEPNKQIKIEPETVDWEETREELDNTMTFLFQEKMKTKIKEETCSSGNVVFDDWESFTAAFPFECNKCKTCFGTKNEMEYHTTEKCQYNWKRMTQCPRLRKSDVIGEIQHLMQR